MNDKAAATVSMIFREIRLGNEGTESECSQ
jgi:hypothetical protein